MVTNKWRKGRKLPSAVCLFIDLTTTLLGIIYYPNILETSSKWRCTSPPPTQGRTQTYTHSHKLDNGKLTFLFISNAWLVTVNVLLTMTCLRLFVHQPTMLGVTYRSNMMMQATSSKHTRIHSCIDIRTHRDTQLAEILRFCAVNFPITHSNAF